MIINTPIGTPNLYGYPLCGNIAEQTCTEGNNLVAFNTVTSSAFADQQADLTEVVHSPARLF